MLSTPRIGIVMPLASQAGGAELLLQHLLRCSSGSTRFFCAFLEDGPLVTEARQQGHEVAVIPGARLRNPLRVAGTIQALRRWTREMRLHLVVSWMPKAHLYLGIAALGLPVRNLWFQHGVPDRSWLDRLCTAIPSDGVLCCSKVARAAQDRMWPPRATAVCYPGVPSPSVRTVTKAEACAALNLPQQRPVVGMVSRLERWKGVHVFLQAATYLHARRPDAFFFVVGGVHSLAPEYATEVQAQAAAMPDPSAVMLAGQRPASEVSMWQVAADIMVHPTVGTEPFGMALVEAMARGKPVIASDRGGHAEIVADRQNGRLTATGDARELAEVILELLNDEPQRLKLGERASVRANTFSDAAFTARFLELCSQFLSARTGPTGTADAATGLRSNHFVETS